MDREIQGKSERCEIYGRARDEKGRNERGRVREGSESLKEERGEVNE